MRTDIARLRGHLHYLSTCLDEGELREGTIFIALITKELAKLRDLITEQLSINEEANNETKETVSLVAGEEADNVTGE